MNKCLLIAFLFLVGCKSAEKSLTLSGTLQKKIDQFKSASVCEDARISEFNINGELVYLFEYGSCIKDKESPVYDKSGNLLGAIGGFTGNMQLNGNDFSKAEFKREIWRKKQTSDL